jgi:hypothetical protein
VGAGKPPLKEGPTLEGATLVGRSDVKLQILARSLDAESLFHQEQEEVILII